LHFPLHGTVHPAAPEKKTVDHPDQAGKQGQYDQQ
jgi:hypothetical protein